MNRNLLRAGLFVLALTVAVVLLRSSAPAKTQGDCCEQSCKAKSIPADLIQEHFSRQFISTTPLIP